LGWIYLWKKQYDHAITEGERAIALDPNCAGCYADLGIFLIAAGRPQETMGLVKKAMRLNPSEPFLYLWF
jgi:tetratricopeptide (TPR) repeat protein